MTELKIIENYIELYAYQNLYKFKIDLNVFEQRKRKQRNWIKSN